MVFPSIPELLAVIFAIAYVIFAAFEKVICWLFAGISSALFAFVCFNSYLYAESMLQLFYLIMAGYGFLKWKNSQDSWQAIRNIQRKELFSGMGMSILFGVLVGFLLKTQTRAAWPYTDACIFTFSIWTTFLVVQKVLENWLLWMIIDFVAGILYFDRALYLTSILYFFYILLAAWGYYQWILIRKKNRFA